MSERDARRWAALCHVSALVGLLGNGIGFVLAPLVIWLIKRNDDPFIDEQGKEALNFQISMMIWLLIAGVLCFVLIGFPILIGLVIFDLVVTIMAAIQANQGHYYRYPLTIRFMQ